MVFYADWVGSSLIVSGQRQPAFEAPCMVLQSPEISIIMNVRASYGAVVFTLICEISSMLQMPNLRLESPNRSRLGG